MDLPLTVLGFLSDALSQDLGLVQRTLLTILSAV